MKIKRIPNPPDTEVRLKKVGSLWVKTFKSDTGLGMFYTLDPTQHGELHHLSISRQHYYPSWDEIKKAKEFIMGDIDVMMILPKKQDYVNVHSFCFHLWETPVAWAVM